MRTAKLSIILRSRFRALLICVYYDEEQAPNIFASSNRRGYFLRDVAPPPAIKYKANFRFRNRVLQVSERLG